MSYEEFQAERLDAYRIVATYARAYRQAVDAEDANWESGMRRELDAAMLRVRRLENRAQVEAAV